MKTLILCGVVLASTGACVAQTAMYQRCMLAAKGNSAQVFQCNTQEMVRQDKRVDADYRQLQVRAQHDPVKQADVRTDQRDWLQHRDFACSKANESENLPCMIRETAAKADALDARLRSAGH